MVLLTILIPIVDIFICFFWHVWHSEGCVIHCKDGYDWSIEVFGNSGCLDHL